MNSKGIVIGVATATMLLSTALVNYQYGHDAGYKKGLDDRVCRTTIQVPIPSGYLLCKPPMMMMTEEQYDKATKAIRGK